MLKKLNTVLKTILLIIAIFILYSIATDIIAEELTEDYDPNLPEVNEQELRKELNNIK